MTTRGRWDQKAMLFVIEEFVGNRWRILAFLSRDDAVEFTEQCQAECNRAWGVTDDDLRDEDDEVRLADDADVPQVVRLADGSARVDLTFDGR